MYVHTLGRWVENWCKGWVRDGLWAGFMLMLCLNEQSGVFLRRPGSVSNWLDKWQLNPPLFPEEAGPCFCLCGNNSHKVWSFQSVKLLLINTGLFLFVYLLFISSNYHSKGGVFLARRSGNTRLKGNEETSVSPLCHKSASHSYLWHPNRQRLQCRKK